MRSPRSHIRSSAAVHGTISVSSVCSADDACLRNNGLLFSLQKSSNGGECDFTRRRDAKRRHCIGRPSLRRKHTDAWRARDKRHDCESPRKQKARLKQRAGSYSPLSGSRLETTSRMTSRTTSPRPSEQRGPVHEHTGTRATTERERNRRERAARIQRIRARNTQRGTTSAIK